MADGAMDRTSLISDFCNVTGVESGRAQLYLEAAGWNLDLALASFYEESEEAGGGSPPLIEEPSPSDAAKSQQAPTSTSSPNKFATLFSLPRKSGNKNDSSDEEEGQAFYAGGSERSGQQVLGPGKKKGGNDIVAEMFKAAKEHGAQMIDPNEMGRDRGRASAFKGTGFRLGSAENDSVPVTGGKPTSSNPPVDMHLKLWKTGFSIDDSQLRDYEDPANKDFLESVRRGEIPRELVRLAKGEVNLNMEDHRHEDFVAPKRKVPAFGGEGHRLGSPAPNISLIGNDFNKQSEEEQKKTEENALSMMSVDSSQPTTSIQIRLADGSKLVAKLNHTHTVGDIRRFIVNARPNYSSALFTLMTTFPNKELTEDSISLKEAGLLNAVIVQRLQ